MKSMIKEHPGGFAVFENKQQSIPWMFDTPTPEAQAQFVKGIQSQLEYIKLGVHQVWSDPRVQAGSKKNQRDAQKLLKNGGHKKDGKFDDETNDQLDAVDDLLDVLHGKALDIGGKIQEQDKYIHDMQEKATTARGNMAQQKDRMHNVMKETDKNWI